MSEKIFQQVPAPLLPRYTDEEIRIRSIRCHNFIVNIFEAKKWYVITKTLLTK